MSTMSSSYGVTRFHGRTLVFGSIDRNSTPLPSGAYAQLT